MIWKRQWQSTPVLLPGNSHGRRSLVGYSPWGCEESTQLSNFTFTFHFHSLEKEMATHSRRIPGRGEPNGLPSMGSHRVGHNWSNLAAAAAIYDYALFTSGLETWTDTTENISVKSNSQIIHIGKGNLVCTGSKGQHDSDDRLTEFSSVQFSSIVQSCPTLCNPMNYSTPGLPVHHQLPEFTQTHVHWVSDAIQPSHPLSSPSPPALNPSQH